MRAKSILTGLSLTLVVPLLLAASLRAAGAGPATPATPAPNLKQPPSINYEANFEKTIQPWTAGSNDLSMSVGLTRREGDNGCGDGGHAYANLESYPSPIQGNTQAAAQPDIAPLPIVTWAAASFSAPTGPVDVTLDWTERDLSLCEGCTTAIYIGTQAPGPTTQFRMLGPGLSKQWQNFVYETSLLYGNTGTVYVAIGWMGSGAHVGLDCITVNIQAHFDYNYGFETGVEPWQPVVLNGESSTLDRSLGDAGCNGSKRAWHAVLRNYWGPQDAGTGAGSNVPIPPVFRLMQATFPPSSDRFSYVEVTWSARNEYGCAGCTPVVYVGTSPLANGAQLMPLAALTADFWQTMGYGATILTQGASSVYVAIGWEEPLMAQRPRAVGYDCLNIHIEPADIYP